MSNLTTVLFINIPEPVLAGTGPSYDLGKGHLQADELQSGIPPLDRHKRVTQLCMWNLQSLRWIAASAGHLCAGRP